MSSSLAKRSAEELAQDVLIAVELDGSGSMAAHTVETRAAFNAFLDDRKTDANVRFTCRTFSEESRLVYDGMSHGAKRLTRENYNPVGGTALYDAIVRGVERIEVLPEPPAEVLFVVFSDGEDSSSRSNATAVRAAISAKRELGWRFLFFAPDERMRAAAYDMGFRSEDVASYAARNGGFQDAFRRLSVGTRRYLAAAQAMLPPGPLLK